MKVLRFAVNGHPGDRWTFGRGKNAMPERTGFEDLMRRVRGGDAQAAAELVRDYEPIIRSVVRARLRNPAMRRLFDSMDICQSVLAKFFRRVAGGQYPVTRPEELVRLLGTMARNQLAKQTKKLHARRRDVRRQGAIDLDALAAAGASPSSEVAHRELLAEFHRRLSAEERYLADQRALGRSWQDLAAQTGGQPDALRMQLRRAVERIAGELGLSN
jgi:RNA polymerase sigma-70 factor (ECF subfamily)